MAEAAGEKANPIEQANAAFGTGDYKTALDLWTSALTSVGAEHHYALHTNRGAALERLGQIEDAIKAYDDALASKPSHVEALHNKGVALKALKRYPEALASFEEALKHKAEFYPSLRGRCDALTVLERFEEAVAAATAAIAARPTDPSPYADRAFALLKSKRLDDALADYTKARELGDSSNETRRLQAIALSQRAVELDKEGDLVKAEDYYNQAIDFEATESRLFNRAFLLMRTGRTDAAIEGYRAVAAMAPANFQARAALGTLLLQRDDFKGAIPVLKEAEALNKAAVDIVFNLGFAYLREDDVDAAEAQFKRALEIDPDMDNAKNGLAAVEAARDSTKLNVTVGETIEVPGSSGPGSSSAAASGSGAGSAAPAAAAAAGGAGSSAAAAAPAAPGAAAPAASAGSAAAAGASPAAARPAIAGAVAAPPSATPALAAMRTASARREVRASVPPQLLGALAASMRGPAEAMGGAGGAGGVGPVAEDSEVRFTRDEDGVEGVVFAYAQLKAPGPYPAGVDSSHREAYLSREEFKKVLGVGKADFFAMPKWKRIDLRKKAGLF